MTTTSSGARAFSRPSTFAHVVHHEHGDRLEAPLFRLLRCLERGVVLVAQGQASVSSTAAIAREQRRGGHDIRRSCSSIGVDSIPVRHRREVWPWQETAGQSGLPGQSQTNGANPFNRRACNKRLISDDRRPTEERSEASAPSDDRADLRFCWGPPVSILIARVGFRALRQDGLEDCPRIAGGVVTESRRTLVGERSLECS